MMFSPVGFPGEARLGSWNTCVPPVSGSQILRLGNKEEKSPDRKGTSGTFANASLIFDSRYP